MFPAQPQGQVPETFNIATPRRSSVPSSPNSPTTPATSVRSRSPPRELPGEAGNTAPSDVAGEGGMEVETGAHKISGISDELLPKFVEGDDENVVADVVEFSNIRVFNHVWVDKKRNGVAKSRLTCADVKHKQTPEQRLSSEGQSNFCPTPHPASLKFLWQRAPVSRSKCFEYLFQFFNFLQPCHVPFFW